MNPCKISEPYDTPSGRKANSASADGGPRSRVSARQTLRFGPFRHKRKFFGPSVWGGGANKLKKCPINFLAISGKSKHFSFFPEKTPKKSTL